MNNTGSRLKVFLVDDEPLALERLERMLVATNRVQILGNATDPEDAIAEIHEKQPEAIFLDISMPVLNGFEMLARLDFQPIVIFTTAFDQYALRAFEVNSIDYLLKPIEAEHLDRALRKIERLCRGGEQRPEWQAAIEELAATLNKSQTRFPDRIGFRAGERTEFIELSEIMYFRAENKLTFAVTAAKKHAVNYSIIELEQKLDPRDFVRIHRSILLNTNYVKEIHPWFAGKVLIRLKDEKRTELTVTRDRVRTLKERLNF